ncbi:MAG: hypothetical protein ACRDJH_07770 [Thermomicrobiales bacterium]
MGRGTRLLALAIVVVLVLGTAGPVGAQTTATTGISVTTKNAGAFLVEFAPVDGGYVFVNATGGATFSVSATTGDTATATAMLAWSDSRADGERTEYSIAMSANDLTSTADRPDGNGTYGISAGQITVIRIGDDVLPLPLALDTPRTIFTSGADPAAGDGSLAIAIRLDVPPSSYPTTYTTRLVVQVSFDGNSP